MLAQQCCVLMPFIDRCAKFLAELRLQGCVLLLCSSVACSWLQSGVTVLSSAVARELCAVLQPASLCSSNSSDKEVVVLSPCMQVL